MDSAVQARESQNMSLGSIPGACRLAKPDAALTVSKNFALDPQRTPKIDRTNIQSVGNNDVLHPVTRRQFAVTYRFKMFMG
eukprot:1171023-Amphidinium_carterae.1